MIRIRIPGWVYQTALEISDAREPRFQNQFSALKLKTSVADDVRLKKHVESVIGYIGDVCACEWLGIDPKEMLRAMIVETDLLTHRDRHDLVFRGHRIDVKTELFKARSFKAILNRTISPTQPFGCRLINGTQFRENSRTIDIYLFGTIDSEDDPRKAKYWHPVGWITKTKCERVAPKPRRSTPAGKPLHVPAHCIPNTELEAAETLPEVIAKLNCVTVMKNRVDAARLAKLDQERYRNLLKRLELD